MAAKRNSSYVQVASRIELQQLRYFVAVAEELNFSKAAERLYVSQPLLSQQISALESELEMKLFHRSTKSVSLTPNGEIFLTEVRHILARTDAAIQAAAKASSGKEHKIELNLICDTLFDQAVLTEGAWRFMTEHPAYACFLRVEPYFTVTSAIENREADIGITFFTDEDPLSDEIHAERLGDDYLELVLPLLQGKETDPAKAIAGLPLLLPERDSRLLALSQSFCASLGIEPQIIFQQSYQDIIMGVEIGNRFTILPHRIARRFADRSLCLYSLENISPIRLHYVICWPPENELVPLDVLTAYFSI